ncbi:YcxB family protein [Variovorax boronicumulans]|uniref:YcxB family protein n=1 Tax=Variovorax boronicumulans TaxID=436515 RepID=UPI00339B2676
MTATFKISEDDYVDAMRLYGRMPRLARWVVIAIAAGLLLTAIFGSRQIQSGALGGLVGGTLVLLALRYLVLPMSARRHYRKYKGIQDEFSVELQDDCLRLWAAHGESRIIWTNLLKWRQDDRFVLLYLMPRLFHVLPKSVASQGFDVDALVERLNRHLGPET